ncbi:MAG TPA: hydrogenase formation protein HypD [Desulfatiglandales bacterium]|nr:hydrogenase formation protein HypD [Desulfatiglandales bacterium]
MNQGRRIDKDGNATVMLGEISRLADRHLRFMEVCGTHTVSIFRSGIRSLLPKEIELVSGPGCPVCVTPAGEIDRAIAMAALKDVTLLTFGDLMRVPGSSSSLFQERAVGRDIRVITSPLDALEVALKEPKRRIVFFGVGFETTSPAIAAAVKESQRSGISNFYLLSSQRLVPPAIRALLSSGNVKIDGFILPGHVSVIIGKEPYSFIAGEFFLKGVITGFEALDILEGIYMVLRQKREGRSEIEIQYTRAVREEGNPLALKIMEEVFKPVDMRWRGLGIIPKSGIALREEFQEMDAAKVFDIPYKDKTDPPACLCGEILQGLKRPPECPLFGTRCTPQDPVGPCMVSSEGSCSAYYKYGGL